MLPQKKMIKEMGRFDWNGKLTWLVLIYIASFQERTQMPCYTPEINAPKVPEHYLIKFGKLISFKSISSYLHFLKMCFFV